MMKFSAEQQQVIDAVDNIIVSAGAGSGKTTVMIRNILKRIIERGAELSKMLIVTFTKAAAADMKVKLAAGLAEAKLAAKQAGDTAAVEKITAAEEDMPISDIGTLHSFCYRLISSNFFAAGIDPSAGIADDGETAVILDGAVQAAIAAALESGDADFATVNDMLTKHASSKTLAKKIKAIVEFALSLPDDEEQKYLAESRPDEEFFAELEAVKTKRRAELVERTEELKRTILSNNFVKLVDAIDDLVPYIDFVLDAVRQTKVPADTPDIWINDEYKALKTDCKNYRAFVADAEHAKKLDSARYSRALLAVACDALCRYQERKAVRGMLDYSDLEHGALRVLSDDGCRAELAERIEYVYIDEFQDVNPLQNKIADKLAENATMFVVGDIKQSIYGFRRCDPKYFAEAKQNERYKHISLNGNYRSSSAVIDFVNKVFLDKMTENCGGVDYKEEKLVCKKSDLDGACEYVKIVSDNDVAVDTADEPTAEQGDFEQKSADAACESAAPRGYSVENAGSSVEFDPEAVYVASRIKQYLDAHKDRSVAVLTRSVGTVFCSDLTELLGMYGVPYRIGRGSKLSECHEVVALLDILRCIDNRYDDLALYTALRSPMGGFSDRELLAIADVGERDAEKNGVEKARGKRYAFWQKVAAYDGAEFAARLRAFDSLRTEIANIAKAKDAADTLGYITSAIDYFRYVYEQCPNGGAAENVESLISLAAARNCDVHAFIEYCDKTAVELPAPSGMSSVTITTMHSSKGLEYDFVIVAETSKKFNKQDIHATAIVSDAGVAIKCPDFENGSLVESVPHIVARENGNDKLVAEEMRLFYVALTRAKHDLLVTGKVKEDDLSDDKDDISRYKTFGDFMNGMPFAVVKDPTLPTAETVETNAVAIAPADAEKVKEYFEQLVEKDKEEKNGDRKDKKRVELKTCVTAIAESADEDYTSSAHVLTQDEVYDDSSAGDRGKTVHDGGEKSRLRGTAYHRAMELVDFDAPDMDYVAAHCENYELVTPDEILVAAAKMRALTKDAAHVLREQYFIIDLSGPNEQGEYVERPLLQGIIDLLIIGADGKATVLDYKTTAPSGLGCDAYRKQLDLYARAVEQSTPYKVEKKYLYSFVRGELYEFGDDGLHAVEKP